MMNREMPAWAVNEGWSQSDWDDFVEEVESEQAHRSNDSADDWPDDDPWQDEDHDALEAAVRSFLATGLAKGVGPEWTEVVKLAAVVDWGPHDAVAFYAAPLILSNITGLPGLREDLRALDDLLKKI